MLCGDIGRKSTLSVHTLLVICRRVYVHLRGRDSADIASPGLDVSYFSSILYIVHKVFVLFLPKSLVHLFLWRSVAFGSACHFLSHTLVLCIVYLSRFLGLLTGAFVFVNAVFGKFTTSDSARNEIICLSHIKFRWTIIHLWRPL